MCNCKQVKETGYEGVTLEGIVEQLISCNYECEAGPLENNLAFIELKRRANRIPNGLYPVAEMEIWRTKVKELQEKVDVMKRQIEELTEKNNELKMYNEQLNYDVESTENAKEKKQKILNFHFVIE